jgi:hypothetical protein
MNEAHPAATRSIGSANFSRRGCDRSLVGDGGLQGRKVFEIPIKRRVPPSGKTGDKPTTVAATYAVEKGKPLASPA